MLNFTSFWHNWKHLGPDQDGRLHFQVKVKPDVDVTNEGNLLLDNFVHPMTGKHLKKDLLRTIYDKHKNEIAYWRYHEGDCSLCFTP